MNTGCRTSQSSGRGPEARAADFQRYARPCAIYSHVSSDASTNDLNSGREAGVADHA